MSPTTKKLEGVLAVWNPRPNMLPLGVPGMSEDCNIRCAREKPFYHPNQPTIVVAESGSRRRLEFEAPDAPPGTYLVVVYDGGGNGFHYTWEFFRLLASARGTIRSQGETRV
jgi:hypothetical protein